MGYALYREVKVWAPPSLTKGEKLAAMVLADDANDQTRLTYSSTIDPEIMRQAMVKDDRAMRRIIAKLKDEKVLEHAGGGHNGRTAKYRFLHLAPAESTSVMPGENRPPTDGVAGTKSPGYGDQRGSAPGENHPATDGVGGQFFASSRVKTTRPTPSPPTTASSPDTSAVTEPSAGDGGGGGDQQQDEQRLAAAAAFLQALPIPWTVGRITAPALAPLLLEHATAQGWQLDADLVAELTKSPDGIRDHRAVLPRRIADLPKRAAVRQPAEQDAPDWCGKCDARDYRWINTGNGWKPCPDCGDHQ